MKTYQDYGGDSGVAAYEAGSDSITVQFKDGAVYLYTNMSTGAQNIQKMKALAENGNGLNSFINSNVRKLYAKKVR